MAWVLSGCSSFVRAVALWFGLYAVWWWDVCVRVHWCVCVYAINILILVGEAARLPEVCTGLEANKCAPCDKDNDNEGKSREQGREKRRMHRVGQELCILPVSLCECV